MRNKKISEIEVLEKRITNLEDSNRRLREVVDFLSENDKEEIVIERGMLSGEYLLHYLYAQKVHHIRTGISAFSRALNVVKRDYWLGAVIFECDKQYYQLNIKSETFVPISKPAFVLEQELAEKEALAKKEKASGRKKSAKSAKEAK